MVEQFIKLGKKVSVLLVRKNYGLKKKDGGINQRREKEIID